MFRKTISLGLPTAFTLAILVGSSTPAQAPERTGTLPKGYEWVEATSFTHIPFGLTAGRTQQVWGASHVPGNGQPGQMINSIMLRRDKSGWATKAFWVECELGFGGYLGDPRSTSPTFANNLGVGYRIVFSRKRLNIGATNSSTPPGPMPWLPAIGLDKPFYFTAAVMKSLLFEVKVFSADPGTPGTAFTMDSHKIASGFALASRPGTGPVGCGVTKTAPPMSLKLNIKQRSLRITIANASPSLPLMINLGTSSTAMGFLPLPLDLGPLGAPGCNLFTDILIPLFYAADALGDFNHTLTLPATNLCPPGFPLYLQAFAPTQPGVNAMGLAVSNGAVTHISQLVPNSIIYNTVSPTAPTGTVKVKGGIVLGFKYK